MSFRLKEEFQHFERLSRIQKTLIGQKKGVIIKDELGNQPKDLDCTRECLKELIRYYKPHEIKKPTYYRWSFQIPTEVEFESAFGANLVIIWHKEPSKMEWLEISIKEKHWIKGNYPPCLWKKVA